MKKFMFLILLTGMTIFFISCKSETKHAVSDNDKLRVSVSFNAIYEFALAVGQDKVDINTVIPAGSEAHGFEPKVADITALSKADVFIYNGLNMEPWAEEAIQAAENDNLEIVIISDGVNVIDISDAEHEHEEDVHEAEDHGSSDPHTWLSLKEAQIGVQNIADGFSDADPVNKDYYQANAADYIQQLETIYLEYDHKFSTLQNKHFVTGHAAFGYFCRDFGLEQISVRDVFAEGEPSTQQLAKLVDYCKEQDITTIFSEELASPLVSETLANEVGAKVQTIYTMEHPEDNQSYLERISKNCERVYQSLSK